MNLSEPAQRPPDLGIAHVASIPPRYVPITDAAEHPLLRFARVAGRQLEWPGLNHNQRLSVSRLKLVEHTSGPAISLPPRVNFDFFVTADTDETLPAPELGRATDRQRYYARSAGTSLTGQDAGVRRGANGTYTAITIDGIRRYFHWLTEWVEIGLTGFLQARDDRDSYFVEISFDEMMQSEPAAFEQHPVPSRPRAMHVVPASGTAVVSSINAATIVRPPRQERRPDASVETAAAPDRPLALSELDAVTQCTRASAIAIIAHRGQVDRVGYAYIDHPARVAGAFHRVGQAVEHCAAWLHEVLKSTDLSTKDLLDAGVLPEIVEVVDALTRSDGMTDDVYYARIRELPAARAVKLADIDDNLAEWRFRKLDHETQARLSRRYATARAALG